MGEEGGLDTSRLQGRGRDANHRLLSLPGSWARMSDRCKGLNVGVTLYEVAPTKCSDVSGGAGSGGGSRT